MHRFAWKNRVTLGVGVGIASLALVAGCADEDEPEDELGIDTTATETMTTEPTATMTETATTETTATATEGTDDEAEDVTVNITADGLMMDGTAASDLSLTAGSTVTFQNDGAAAVTVTTDDGAIDEEVEAGESFEYTFEEAGTWTLLVDGEEMSTITVE